MASSTELWSAPLRVGADTLLRATRPVEDPVELTPGAHAIVSTSSAYSTHEAASHTSSLSGVKAEVPRKGVPLVMGNLGAPQA